jgi:hypothetical protein
VQDDLIEGGAGLVALMAKLESGEAEMVEAKDGALQLVIHDAPPPRRQAQAGKER